MIGPCSTFLKTELGQHLDIEDALQDNLYPFINSHLNIDVETLLFHTEDDITYTEISVPRQFNGKSIHESLNFLYRLNVEEMLRFTMCEGFHQIYSGMLLSHKQNKKTRTTNEMPMVNMSAYANRKIFLHIRQSLLRFRKKFKLFYQLEGNYTRNP